MSEYPAIIAALPREIKPLVKGWQVHRLPGNVVAFTQGNAVVACAGMGADRATLAVRAAMSLKPVTMLVSVGLAGACKPALEAGNMVRAGVVVDARTGERTTAGEEFREIVVTTDSIASVAEKARLRAAYYADAVDMEAATVARLARGHGLKFRAFKAISDASDFELEELGRFVTPDGQFREAAFAAYAALRPWLWSRLIRLARNSHAAVESLTAAVGLELDLYQERAKRQA
jgi:adenosylhomocysteine nucleosidase